MTDKTSEIIWVSGPVMRSSGGDVLSMYETVEVGAARLIGEVIALDGEVATLQIYEDTGGIRPGDPVVGQGAPSVGGDRAGFARPDLRRHPETPERPEARHRRLYRPGGHRHPPGPGEGLAV